jgi:hypothetical protein
MVNRLLVSVVLMQMLMILSAYFLSLWVSGTRLISHTTAIGLQAPGGFRGFFWVSTLPPILIILVFKIFLKRKFGNSFRYYMPTEGELRNIKLHSERGDTRGHRLEKRFGHPALQSDLFTPMLHSKMMPLLSEVYKGKIGSDYAQLNEYGGQKLEAQVVEGGVRFAAVDQVSLLTLPIRWYWFKRTDISLNFTCSAIWSTILLYTNGTEGSSTGTNGP